MKAIILAAGKGERMLPLTKTIPKPLIPVSGRPILDRLFEAMPEEITDVMIVVLYLAEKIQEHCGNNFHGRKISYAQGSAEGNAKSFLAAKDFVRNEPRFLLLQGDELPYWKDIKHCLDFPSSTLCFEVEDPWNHGVAMLRPDGTIESVVEKPKEPASNLVNDGVMVLTPKIFDCFPEIGPMGEYYFSGMFNQYIKKEKVTAVKTQYGWVGFSSPADIIHIEEILKQRPALTRLEIE